MPDAHACAFIPGCWKIMRSPMSNLNLKIFLRIVNVARRRHRGTPGGWDIDPGMGATPPKGANPYQKNNGHSEVA